MTELYKRDGRSLFSTFSKLNAFNKLNTKVKSFFNVPDTCQPDDIESIVTDERLQWRYVPNEQTRKLKEDMKYFKSQRFFGHKKTFKI